MPQASRRPPTSTLAACCWIPLFALRCEEARRPELAGLPLAILSPDDARRVWQVSPLARRSGVRAGLTVSQAIGLCPALTLIEPDPVHYDERFSALLARLSNVSPVVEPQELGRAFVGSDGMEGIYGGPERFVEAVKRGMRNAERGTETESPIACSAFPLPRSAFRIGWGAGKFTAWVAATRAKPGAAVIVPPGDEARFLAGQPIAVLPLDPDTHRRLRRLGVNTLGKLAALPEEAVVSQFGKPGRRIWRLAAGRAVEPVVGRVLPEPIVVSLAFFTPVAGEELLLASLRQLLARALASPRRIGWRVQTARARAELEQGTSWLAEVTLKDPTADRERILAPLRVRLSQSPPAGAVERLTVEFTAFAPGTTELQLFARDATAAARAGRRRALRAATEEIRLKLRRTFLYHVIEVQPWSRLPERRYALIDYEP
ncbi:MAG TPA: hypothetical protein VFK78_06770 [Gemmatimonadales bacterium]|nr:hypothetical protein [Gemmatimonadales bacterium]